MKNLAKIHMLKNEFEMAYRYYEKVSVLRKDINTVEDDLIVIDADWKVKLGIEMAKSG